MSSKVKSVRDNSYLFVSLVAHEKNQIGIDGFVAPIRVTNAISLVLSI